MRNKKLIFVVALVLIVATVLCVFVGCQKKVTPAEILMSFKSDDTKSTVKTQELTNLKGYTNVTSLGDGVVTARKSNEDSGYTYVLFNVEENKVIATSDSSFSKVENGIYVTTKTSDDGETTYTFYDNKTAIKSNLTVDEFEYNYNSNGVTFADGTVAIPTENGVVVLEQTIANAMNIAYFDDLDVIYKNDSVTVLGSDEVYIVFDAQGNFKDYVDIYRLVNATKGDELEVFDLGKGKVLIQVTKELTEVEAENGFTYVSKEKYYAMSTYVCELVSKNLTNVDFNYVVDYSMPSKKGDYVAVYASQIVSKRISQVESCFVTDTDLNVKLQLTDIVSDAMYFGVIDDSTYAIIGEAMVYVYDANGNLVNSFSSNLIGSYGLLKVGNVFYDFKGNEILKLTKDMEIQMVSNGLIYYTKENSDDTSSIVIFDTKSKSNIATYDLEKYNTISNDFFTIEDADGNIQIFSAYMGKAISNKKFASASVRTLGDYYLITATDAEGEITYFSFTIE